ncbi:MAG: hypothetical protein DRJ05_06880, partial [Bacteroidetes bacterium]
IYPLKFCQAAATEACPWLVFSPTRDSLMECLRKVNYESHQAITDSLNRKGFPAWITKLGRLTPTHKLNPKGFGMTMFPL